MNENASAPKWPAECGVLDCVDEDYLRRTGKRQPCATAVAIVVVDDAGGRRRSGSFSDFGNARGLFAGFSFVRWITRCGACYERELDQMGKGQLTREEMAKAQTEAAL